MKIEATVDDSLVVESRKPTILVVEDDIVVRFMTADLLRYSGFDVLEASDGIEAMTLLATGHPFDLVITDLRMPGMDGIELTIRAKLLRANLPVMILSSHLDGRDHQADHFLAKPYDPQELVELAERLSQPPLKQQTLQQSRAS